MKRCPFCAEEIQDAAVVCKHCGRDLQDVARASAPAVPVKPQEKTYYSGGGIVVTSARAVFPGRTYAMANVTSVSVTTKDSPAVVVGVVLILVGGICLAASLLAGVALAVVGALLLVVGILAVRVKPTHFVRVGSASGEADAVMSTNKDTIQTIVDAINAVMIARG